MAFRSVGTVLRVAGTETAGVSAAVATAATATACTASVAAVAGAVSCSRSFAAAAASPDHVQLPLKLFGVSGRYASSLYVAAVRKNTLAQVADDMATIEALAKENQKFRFFLDNPFIRADVKANVLSEVLPKAGVSPTCQHFFCTDFFVFILRLSVLFARKKKKNGVVLCQRFPWSLIGVVFGRPAVMTNG